MNIGIALADTKRSITYPQMQSTLHQPGSSHFNVVEHSGHQKSLVVVHHAFQALTICTTSSSETG